MLLSLSWIEKEMESLNSDTKESDGEADDKCNDGKHVSFFEQEDAR